MAATSIYKRTLIGLACAGALILVVCVLLYGNRAGKLHTLQADLKQKQNQMDSSEKIAARLPIARREFLDAQAQLGVLEQGVSSRAYVPTFLRQIEQLGKKNHLQVSGVRPKPADERRAAPARSAGKDEKNADGDKAKVAVKPPAPDPYEKLELDIELKGKYWDTVRFMHEITAFPKIVAVNDINISPVDQINAGLASPSLAIRFNATAFILKQQLGGVPKTVKTANVVAEARDGDKG